MRRLNDPDLATRRTSIVDRVLVPAAPAPRRVERTIGVFSLIVLTAVGFLIGGPSRGAFHAARTPVLIGVALFLAVRVIAHRPLKRGLSLCVAPCAARIRRSE